MQEPPKSVEEFLKFQNWDYWPREINWADKDTWTDSLNKIKEDSSFASVYTQLWSNVPRIFERITIMDSRLGEHSLLLQEHASNLSEQDTLISKTSSYEKLKRHKAFLKKYQKRKKIMLSAEMETEKNIEGYNFSGFKTSELTELPRHLDAKQIYLFILKARNFDERVFRIWKMHFLSEASIALLHDCFWWWFLYKFKPDRKDQDCLFDRIAESFVALFMSIPISRKDAFFQVYPDCLAQAIYATFLEAFPESSNLFNDQFKEDLGNNIYLWLSGLKPQKGFWAHWKLKDLSSTTIHGSRKAAAKSLQKRLARSQERLAASFDFNMAKILKNPRAYTIPTSKENSSLSGPKAKSHYCSIGPEFYRILFNFGGQSPVILYYLKMHEIEGISKTSKQKKIKLTEILQEPYPFLKLGFNMIRSSDFAVGRCQADRGSHTGHPSPWAPLSAQYFSVYAKMPKQGYKKYHRSLLHLVPRLLGEERSPQILEIRGCSQGVSRTRVGPQNRGGVGRRGRGSVAAAECGPASEAAGRQTRGRSSRRAEPQRGRQGGLTAGAPGLEWSLGWSSKPKAGREMKRINEEIKHLRQQRERINKEADRVQTKTIKKPYEAKNDFEMFPHKLVRAWTGQWIADQQVDGLMSDMKVPL
ncbi:protein FAM227B [Erethizon dorsatum]